MLGRKTKDDRTPPRTERDGPTGGADSVIAKGMTIDGDCVVDGRIRIEGRIEGDVRASGVDLAESGTVQGDVSCAADPADGPFVIAGEVTGSVRAPRVEVRRSGRVLRGVQGDQVQVRGRVQGGIVARERLVLEATAAVEGDVRARVLGLEEGGQVNGTIVMGEQAAQRERSPG